jgi:hypothetical protein
MGHEARQKNMQRVLKFDGTNKEFDRAVYRILLDGSRLGARIEQQKLQREQKEQTREDRKSETRIRKALHGIGEIYTPPGTDPIEPKAEAGLLIDTRMRILRDGEHEIRLEQGDFTRLQRYVSHSPWIPEAGEAVSNTEDWLEACPPAKES